MASTIVPCVPPPPSSRPRDPSRERHRRPVSGRILSLWAPSNDDIEYDISSRGYRSAVARRRPTLSTTVDQPRRDIISYFASPLAGVAGVTDATNRIRLMIFHKCKLWLVGRGDAFHNFRHRVSTTVHVPVSRVCVGVFFHLCFPALIFLNVFIKFIIINI